MWVGVMERANGVVVTLRQVLLVCQDKSMISGGPILQLER